jgi:hypothetical protein
MAVKNIQPDGVMIGFKYDPNKNNIPPHYGPISIGLINIELGLITPIFVDLFEQHRLWLRTRYGGDANAWPSLFNFARLIRNFISHHRGHIHFDNKNAPPVSWHHVVYSPKDEGKLAVGHGADFLPADIIILLVEFSQELDRVGCPFPL